MTFRFSEAVVRSTFDPTKVILQFSETDDTKKHKLLTDNSGTSDGSSNVEVVVALNDDDVVALKKSLDLCKDKPSTYVSLETGVVADKAANAAVAIASGGAKQATAYEPDRKKPTLQSYFLNMETGVMSVTFDEIMKISSFNANSVFSLQSDLAHGSATETSGTLAGAVTSIANAKVVEITLSAARTGAANAIRAKTGLATDATNTFLTLASTFMTDVDDNAVNVVPSNAAKKVTANGFKADGVAPSIQSFELDLSTDPATLTLLFDQPVKGGSFTNALQLQDAKAATKKVDIVLAEASDAVTTAVVLTLKVSNVNAIKASGFCTKNGNGGDCFLSHGNEMIDDARGLEVAAQAASNGVTCTAYGADGTVPTVVSSQVKKFDLNTGKITLSFSEIVDRTSYQKAKFELQSDSAD